MAEFLSRKGIPFEKRDVRQDAQALDDLLRGGFRSTPITIVDGQSVVGYEPEAIQRLWEE